MRTLLTFGNVLTFLLLVVYLWFFKESLPNWFHPGWTTDDALQQWFMFHDVSGSEIFKNDFIAQLMTGYLAPLHYWLAYLFTSLFGAPIVASHYLMLVQYLLIAVFLFFAVKHVASSAAGFIAVLWLFHTREIVQRMAGGLPRSWAGVVFAAYFCFVLRKNHLAVLLVLFLGCLSHPPATVICALSYGLYLLLGVAKRETRGQCLKPLLILICLSPFYALVTYKIVERPPEVGQMVGPDKAYDMPQLQRPDGRFPFLPLLPIDKEIRMFGFQAFVGRLYNPGKVLKPAIRIFVIVGVLLLFLYGLRQREKAVPVQLYTFLAAIFIVYLTSRQVVFKLYVPDRHVLLPFAFFLISFFTIGVWRAFSSADTLHDTTYKHAWRSILGVCVVLGVAFLGSGTGLYGDGNFNYSSTKKGNVFLWIRENTPENALIAGHPTFIDGVMLFGARKALATTEVYHPFYDGYLKFIEPRLVTSFQAHYAQSLKELVQILAPHHVDYFVFERKRFYPEKLKEEKYFEPLNASIQKLTGRHYTKYAYRELPREIDLEKYPFMPFRDNRSVVVDVAALKKYLEEQKL